MRAAFSQVSTGWAVNQTKPAHIASYAIGGRTANGWGGEGAELVMTKDRKVGIDLYGFRGDNETTSVRVYAPTKEVTDHPLPFDRRKPGSHCLPNDRFRALLFTPAG